MNKKSWIALFGVIIFICCVINSYETKIEEIEHRNTQTIESYNKKIETYKNKIKELTNYKVKISYYVPNLGGINSYGDKNKTAIMEKPIPGKTIAVSRDLIHLLYRKIYIKGLGVFYANDLLANKNPYNNEYIRKQIDICVGTGNDIPKEGVFYNVPIAIDLN